MINGNAEATLSNLPNQEIPLVSVVMPCLNEEKAIGVCIEKIQSTFRKANIHGEIIVCDNGSTDNSVAIAESMGVRVVHQPQRGYGNAYIKGLACAKGKYLIMGDADDTYDFTVIPRFVDYLHQQKYDFVTGSRYLKAGGKNIALLHRFVGNPAITGTLNFLFGTRYTDVYCGFRGFSRQAYDLIEPVSPGMEFNLELAINAGLAKLKIAEIPIQLGPRRGESKLKTFRDGWRSLRMMLLYCPNKVFMLPGVALLGLGVATYAVVLLGLLQYQGRYLSVGTSLFAAMFSVTGFQILSLGLQAKTYSWSRRFDRSNPFLERFYKLFKLESGLLLGGLLILAGAVILGSLLFGWVSSDFAPFKRPEWAALAITLIILGSDTIFTSLLISAMSMKKKRYEQ